VPELPDVEAYGRTFRHHALGKRIRALEVIDPAVFRNVTANEASTALVGRTFVGEERRGKWLIGRAPNVQLVLHFGMTGRLEWLDPDAELGRFVRLRLEFADGSLIYRDPRRLSGTWLCEGDEEVVRVTGPLGPDALGLSFADFDDRLRARRGAIKPALMDQSVLAGIGNMLSDETLWRAGVHPRVAYAALPKTRQAAVHRSLSTVLSQSVRAGSIPRRRGWLSSQRGNAEPRCPKGHGSLRSSKVGGRTALWCPACQPEP
jgi:formamidopyrimidine-DNA glycosylase